MTGLKTDIDGTDEIIEGMCAFVDSYVVPLEERNSEVFSNPRRRFTEDGRFSDEVLELKRNVRMKSASAGFFSMCVPHELGGGGQGPLLHFLTWERLYHRYGTAMHLPYDVLAHWARGPSQIFLDCSEQVAGDIIPRLVSGEESICFSLSEPDAGSNSWNMRTTAVATDGGWRLNGTKQWSTNGPTADYALVFAVTDRAAVQQRSGGITAFLVNTKSPGFRVDSILCLFGAPGGDEAIISMDDVFVPSECVIGKVDGGLDLALSGISLGRMFNAGRAIGMSRWAIEIATKYARERVAFGNAISTYQGIQFPLAESAMKIYASRAIALDCARRLEDDLPVRKELAMVKAFTTESSFEVIDKCMQVFGGMGFTNELGLHEAWHHARISRIADGSGEIMRRTIAKKLLQGDFAF